MDNNEGRIIEEELQQISDQSESELDVTVGEGNQDTSQTRFRIKPRMYNFCMMPFWQSRLYSLEQMALPEKWKFSIPKPDAKNTNNPILHNYITHTFSKLANDFNFMEPEGTKADLFFADDRRIVFNTGLFDRNYRPIYACIGKSAPGSEKEWTFLDFVQMNHQLLFGVNPLPKRAKYIKQMSDLLYNTDYELRINVDHILDDPENQERLPDDMRAMPRHQQVLLFDGALNLSKKMIEANYKAAVPQYYQNAIQLLLPLSFKSYDMVDLALAVKPMDGYYQGYTCLTIDHAYNNARLIARPDSDWLVP